MSGYIWMRKEKMQVNEHVIKYKGRYTRNLLKPIIPREKKNPAFCRNEFSEKVVEISAYFKVLNSDGCSHNEEFSSMNIYSLIVLYLLKLAFEHFNKMALIY